MFIFLFSLIIEVGHDSDVANSSNTRNGQTSVFSLSSAVSPACNVVLLGEVVELAVRLIVLLVSLAFPTPHLLPLEGV